MKVKRIIVSVVALGVMLAGTAAVLAGLDVPAETEVRHTLFDAVRTATEPYHDPAAAEAAGYGLFHGCVSSAREGSMGIHLVNGDFVGDADLDVTKPEAILYQPTRDGRLQLLGVEFLIFADAWHADNDGPPMLMGQMFNYVGSPNRYALPAFYELHVWAWKKNPLGTFADFNPRVTCRYYAPEMQAIGSELQ